MPLRQHAHVVVAGAESAAERGLRMARGLAPGSAAARGGGPIPKPSTYPDPSRRAALPQQRQGARAQAAGRAAPGGGQADVAPGRGPLEGPQAGGPHTADAAVRLAEERARLAGLRGQLEAALARLDADRVTFERRKVRRDRSSLRTHKPYTATTCVNFRARAE